MDEGNDLQSAARGRLVSWLALCFLVLAAALMLWAAGFAGPARAASCTDTWTGAAGDNDWSHAANWSKGAVPGPGDRACLGAGTSVFMHGGNYEVASISDQGSLELGYVPTLTIDGPDVSQFQTLAVGGYVRGAGELHVTGTMSLGGWGAGMYGSGKVVLEPGSTGGVWLPDDTNATWSQRTLVNQGTLTVYGGGFQVGDGAVIQNLGVFAVRGEAATVYARGAASLVNTGTLEKDAGTGTSTVSLPVDNEGTISALTGALRISGDAASGLQHPGSWSAASGASLVIGSPNAMSIGNGAQLSGSIQISGNVSAGDLQGSGAKVRVTGRGYPNYLKVGG